MKIILISCLLFVLGCINNEEIDQIEQIHKTNFEGPGAVFSAHYCSGHVSEINYLRDKRTNLCFGYFWQCGGHGGPGFTNVPCTEEVMKLIHGK